jgi:hypothetical protein
MNELKQHEQVYGNLVRSDILADILKGYNIDKI